MLSVSVHSPRPGWLEVAVMYPTQPKPQHNTPTNYPHQEQLGAFSEEDYLILDCPGQVELYSHIPVMKHFVDFLKVCVCVRTDLN